MTITARNILERARGLLAPANAWTPLIQRIENDMIVERSMNVAFVHAVMQLGIRGLHDPARVEAIKALWKATDGSIAVFEETAGRTQADVLAAFDRAIAFTYQQNGGSKYDT